MNREDILFIGDNRFTFHIVGESANQHELAQMELFAGPEFPVFLKTEPSNDVDSRAIRVLAAFEIPLGYFPQEDATRHWQTIAEIEQSGKTPSCTAKIIGGPDAGPDYSYGLVIDYPDYGWQQLAGHMDGSSRRPRLTASPSSCSTADTPAAPRTP